MDDLRPRSLTSDPADVVHCGRLPAELLPAAQEGSPPFEAFQP